jgi:formylglycine-generating enzyme required for sulfatase activity
VDTQPATCISRNEAKAYLAWLSAKTGRKYRFPTEAEWEYAARAGETKPYYYGGGRKELCAYGNFGDRDSVYATDKHAQCAENPSLEYTYPVGSLKPNKWGLYDMVGNVYEFVEDCFFPNYIGAPSDGSPWLFSKADARYATAAVGQCKYWGIRSYDYMSYDINLRSAARCGAYHDESGRGDSIGLRVAVSMSDAAWDMRR